VREVDSTPAPVLESSPDRSVGGAGAVFYGEAECGDGLAYPAAGGAWFVVVEDYRWDGGFGGTARGDGAGGGGGGGLADLVVADGEGGWCGVGGVLGEEG